MTEFPVRPRLVRPRRELLYPLQPTVVAPPVSGRSRQATARLQLIMIYLGFALVLLAGYLTKPQAAEAEPEPVRLHVKEHTFVEVAPEESVLITAPGETRKAKISHYWPPLGGPNCAEFRDGQCVSNMASGLPWYVWVGRAAACPVELPFWTTVTLPGGETFVCLDRGGKIVTTAAGEIWIDLLIERAPVPYGTVMPVTVRLPYWLAQGGDDVEP